MSTGKKKSKKSKKPSGGGYPIVPIIIGAVVVVGLIIGGMFLMKESGSTKEYDASIAKIREQLNRDPDTAQGPLKLTEVPALVTGNPTVTRETKDGADYSVYQWGDSGRVGFRLRIEKNGPTEEVTELVTFGAAP
jgi:hypothetical protein